MSYIGLLVQRCSIERKINSLNSQGHMLQSWSEIATEVPCRLDKVGNFTSTLSQTPTGQTARNEFLGFFLKNEDIVHGDRIKLKNTSTYLYVTPSLDVYDSKGLHHKELYLAIQET
jgi:hypothetical protein